MRLQGHCEVGRKVRHATSSDGEHKRGSNPRFAAKKIKYMAELMMSSK